MRTFTFAVSKGGVGKSLLTANVGAAIAERGKRAILVEGDPSRPLQRILGARISRGSLRLDNIVKKDLSVQKATYATSHENLFIIPSGISLESYFDIDPVLLAKKLLAADADFMLIDVPFPLGKAAFLSLGICQYFVVILTEDEFNLCVESAIDTNRLGKYLFKCIPVGFILNRIKTPEMFTRGFINDLENLLKVPCITKVMEDLEVSKSYGGAGSREAFLAYYSPKRRIFRENIDRIAQKLVGDLPEPAKEDVPRFLEEIIRPLM